MRSEIDPAALRALVEKAQERVGGISIERMGGDNLAVTLCSHFDDAEGEQDENGWTEAATAGYEETVQAIRDHYQPVFDTLFAHIAKQDDERAADKARIGVLLDALRPFAEADEQYEGDEDWQEVWPTFTVGALRAARSALGGERAE